MTDSIYAKLATARIEFHGMELKKTGYNKFQGYSYFELGDFLIPAMGCLANVGLVPVVSFSNDLATMLVYDTESSKLENSDFIKITSPMRGVQLKGSQPVQDLGAEETYQRRYLWVAQMEIVEHDAIDGADMNNKPKPKAKPKKAPVKKEATKKEQSIYEKEITTPEKAEELCTGLMDKACDDHADSVDSLVAYWKANGEAIDYLKNNYPDEFKRLKQLFTHLKKQITEAEEHE